MKKFILPLLTLAVFIATGCSEKFKVAAPYKDITVVYGLLDQLDTAHYIRIQKAFLDENKSAVTMAKVADSNFFANINVRIERYSFSGTYHDSIHLNRVDLNLEGYPKQSGTFFDAPNYAYKFKDLLDPNYIYRIKVVNLATGKIDSANAPVIEDVNANAFRMYLLDDSNGVHIGLDFAETGANKVIQFSGSYTPPADFTFNGLSSPAIIAQAFVRFNWLDSNILSHAKTAHSYDYNMGYMNLVYNQFEYKVPDINFYTAVRTGLNDAPANTYRLFDRCDLIVYLATQDFSTYQQTMANQGTGLTGSEIQPVYTNIKGKDVLGLFTSRGHKIGKITITRNTMDSMMISPYLNPVKIAGTTY